MKSISPFPTKQEMRDHKRREIVRCASEKFGAEGYENVPLEAIAAELGVTKAALYTYVSSKNDLLMQCYEVGMVRLIGAVEESSRTASDWVGNLRRNNDPQGHAVSLELHPATAIPWR